MAYIERNLARKVTLSDVATAVDLSTSRLAHLIREQSGQTPQQHLEGLRMQRATELLKRTGLSIKLIADSVGFDSVSTASSISCNVSRLGLARVRETFASVPKAERMLGHRDIAALNLGCGPWGGTPLTAFVPG